MNSKLTKPGSYGSQNIFRRIAAYLNDFFFPSSNDGKKKRYAQLRTISLFVISTLVFYFFEDRIQRLVALESMEIQKGMQGFPPTPF